MLDSAILKALYERSNYNGFFRRALEEIHENIKA